MIRLPPLPYTSDALEPHLSEEALRTHHDKHHAAYVASVNRLAADLGLASSPLEAVIGEARRGGCAGLLDQAGQAWNHGFLWRCLAPDPSSVGEGLSRAAVSAFDGLPGLRAAFLEAGGSHFGSGWVWLALKDGRLVVRTTHDGESLVDTPAVPLLVCDLWEHAYYLDYRNERPRYLAAVWDRLTDWAFVERQLDAAVRGEATWEYRDGLKGDPAADLEDALATADWHLARTPQSRTDVARRYKVAAELEQAAALREPAPFADQADDLERRIRELSERLRKDAGDDHWAVLPAF